MAEITNLNVFSGQKQQLFPPKKIPWGARNKSGGGAKTKIGGGYATLLATRLNHIVVTGMFCFQLKKILFTLFENRNLRKVINDEEASQRTQHKGLFSNFVYLFAMLSIYHIFILSIDKKQLHEIDEKCILVKTNK